MFRLVLVVLVTAALLVSASAASPASARRADLHHPVAAARIEAASPLAIARREATDVEAMHACADPGTGSEVRVTPTADSALHADLPDGIALAPLASGLADSLPSAPARLQLTRVSLEPGASSVTRQAPGPVLFSVESGTATVYVNGVSENHPPGASVVIQMGELYALGNNAATPAALLRLSLAPPSARDVPIAIIITPAAEVQTSSSPPTAVPLFQAELTVLPPAPTHLFLACVAWNRTDAASLKASHPGPIGVRVVKGNLVVDAATELPETGCTLIPAGTPHEMRAGADPPVVLLFGAIPEGQDLWLPAGPAPSAPVSPSSAIDCGDA